MTPNENELLGVFGQIEVANAWTMGKRLQYTTEYAENLLKRLLSQGYIEKEVPVKDYMKGVVRRYPSYRLTYRGRQEIKTSKML